jgi:hypothetical protein
MRIWENNWTMDLWAEGGGGIIIVVSLFLFL